MALTDALSLTEAAGSQNGTKIIQGLSVSSVVNSQVYNWFIGPLLKFSVH